MREALWSAVACYRFRSGQLAGRRTVYPELGRRGGEQARGIKAAASCPLQSACGPQVPCFEPNKQLPARPGYPTSEGKLRGCVYGSCVQPMGYRCRKLCDRGIRAMVLDSRRSAG
jgi:hypothetical protein